MPQSGFIPHTYVTGVAGPYTAVVFPTADTFPLSTTVLTSLSANVTVSTIAADTTNSWLTLSSNDYNKDLVRPGAYIFLQQLATRIKSITSDGLTIVLEKGLPGTSASQNLRVTRSKYSKVQISSTGTVAPTLDGKLFAVGLTINYDSRGGVDPIVYNAGAANSQITFATGE